MRNMKHVAPVISLFFLAVATGASAANKFPVSIGTMTPGQMRMASLGHLANVRLVVRMEKHERNWELDVSCDGVDGGIRVSSGKSFWNGEKQAEIYDIGFTLPPATYRCEAVLKRKQEDGKMKDFPSFVEVIVH